MRGSFRRIVAIGRKEFVHISRDPRILISVLAMPVLQLLLFAYAISFDVDNVPAIVLDHDNTTASREYVDAFERSDFFRVVGHVSSTDAVDESFDRSESQVAVIVRQGFAESQLRGQKAEVAILVDGSEPNAAQLAQTYSVALANTLDREAAISWALRRAVDPTAFGGLDVRQRTWYNPERKSADFLIPGLTVVIIMIVTIQQTAVTLVREREEGTLEQILVSPMRRGELMLGKVSPWVLIAMIDMVVITLVGVFVFDVPLRGDIVTYVIATFLFVLCSLAIGLIVSAVATSVETANIAALLISFLPGFMLSNFVFPLQSIPRFLQFVSYLFPGRYMVAIARSVFLKGAGAAVLWPQIGSLAIYAVVSLTLATLLYSRKGA